MTGDCGASILGTQLARRRVWLLHMHDFVTLQVNSPIEEDGARISPRLSVPGVRLALLPPNVHGRLIGRTMRPRFITIHSTENIDATADTHARYLTVKGKRSRNNPRFGRSGWVVWHFTVDDREVVEHLLPTGTRRPR